MHVWDRSGNFLLLSQEEAQRCALRFTFRAKLFSLVLAGALIREILAPFTGHPFDFEIWLRLGYYVSMGEDPYKSTFPIANLSMPGSGYLPSIGYPPIWPLLLAGIYKLYAFIGYNNRFFYYFLLKQPMVISDIIDSLLIYKILLPISGRTRAFRASGFWLLSPFTIIISSVWGMFDQMILMLVLTSVMLLPKTARSALSEALGILLKLIPLLYVLVLSFAQRTRTRIAAYLSLTLGVSVIFALLPYVIFPNWSVSSLYGTGVSVAGTVGNSMNYWVILYVVSLGRTVPSQAFPIISVLSYIWIPAVIIASVFCIQKSKGKLDDPKYLSLSIVFITLVFFLTRSQINEQYLTYFLGFGLIDYYAISSSDRRRLFHAIWIDATAFLVANNAYMVRFLDPISPSYRTLEQSLLSGLLGDVRFGIMISTGLLFTLLSTLYLRSLYHEIRTRTMIDVVVK